MRLGREGGLLQLPEAEVLAVLLHAYDQTPASLARVAAEVRRAWPRSDVYAPALPVGLFSFADPDRLANNLVAEIDGFWTARAAQPDGACYRCIILIGHSLGAVLARKVWALAHGATPAGEADLDQAKPWAAKIERIVLLAATNRGWMVSSAFNPLDRLMWTVGTGWGNFCRFVLQRELLILGFRRGAPFMTTTRLQCLAVDSALAGKAPVVVQLLGTADDYVAPTDNIDLATGNGFYYLEVTGATHKGIVTLQEGDGERGALCRFRAALTAERETLRGLALHRADVFDLFEESPDDFDAVEPAKRGGKVSHVVFVIHGIRDRGFWTRRIARCIKQLARDQGQLCRSVTSTYGYFPMGAFLAPWTRRTKVEWLLDQYVTAKALYPQAQFAYLGHSNGTYLLAKALELCPAVRFGRVVFAGSVVRCGYDWQRYLAQKLTGRAAAWQVERIVNYVATADWVVAVFPQGLERLRLPDLGGAGHLGFGRGPAVVNVLHVSGGHGAALAADNWDEMARFVLGGADPAADRHTRPSVLVGWLGRFAPAVWLIIVCAVLGIGALLLVPLGHPGWLFALGFALYLGLLRVIVTKA